MQKTIWFVIMMANLVLSSCGTKSSPINMGVTTRSELVAIKGEPIREDSIPVKDGQLLVFSDEEKYQLSGDVVVHSFRNPKGDESLVIFWKHKFKDCLTTIKKISPLVNSHTPPEIEYACPEQGLTVIYSEGSDSISRILEYEKK
jgi:hypothetical protein